MSCGQLLSKPLAISLSKWQLAKPAVQNGQHLLASCDANIENCASVKVAIAFSPMGKDTLALPASAGSTRRVLTDRRRPSWPTEPYEFLVWWHCGYPASDAACERGWKSLTTITGMEPEKLLAVPMPKLAAALKPGGMVPELRALRLKEIAARVKDEFGGDLRGALSGPISECAQGP